MQKGQLLIGGIAAFALGLSIAGCSYLPAAAPTVSEVEYPGFSDPGFPMLVLNTNSAVVNLLDKEHPIEFSGAFRSNAPAPNLRISVGDTLQIGVIEAGGGLFGAQPGNLGTGVQPTLGAESVSAGSTLLLPVTVERDGTINVPYAGVVHAAGKTARELGTEIEQKLAGKANNPQVEVYDSTLTTINANSVAVDGEVNKAGVFPLLPSGSKLLDLIAEAGGAKDPAYETDVHLTRGHVTVTASLQNIIDHSANNIYIKPRDTIYLTRNPRTFTVLGATSKVGRYPFDTKRVTLAEAVAEGGGFSDQLADPSGVFLFRIEPAQIVEQIRPDLAGKLTPEVPVIFRVDLRGGDGYFLAQHLEMQDKDVVLLSNASGTQWLKFLAITRGITGIVSDFRGFPAPATSSSFQ